MVAYPICRATASGTVSGAIFSWKYVKEKKNKQTITINSMRHPDRLRVIEASFTTFHPIYNSGSVICSNDNNTAPSAEGAMITCKYRERILFALFPPLPPPPPPLHNINLIKRLCSVVQLRNDELRRDTVPLPSWCCCCCCTVERFFLLLPIENGSELDPLNHTVHLGGLPYTGDCYWFRSRFDQKRDLIETF